jgi:hypothetical protein
MRPIAEDLILVNLCLFIPPGFAKGLALKCRCTALRRNVRSVASKARDLLIPDRGH